MASPRPTRVITTSIPDTWAWVRPDLARRILPFTVVSVLTYLIWRPRWLGFGVGDLKAQVIFALACVIPAFWLSALVGRRLASARGVVVVPADARSAAAEAAFYVVNGPVEEAFFRGLVQGGIGAFAWAPAGFVIATAAYVLYHRLGGWSWPATAATALIGVPLGLAFWLLPGPPSLLGVSIVHIVATMGFLGPGPFLLRKLASR